MFNIFIPLILWVLSGPAFAQNVTCATRPPGDKSNACASTAFVYNGYAIYFPGLTTNVESTGIPGLDGGSNAVSWMIYSHPSTVDSQVAAFRVDRHPTYTGGSPSTVRSAIWNNCTINIGVATLEWCGLDTAANYAAGGQNVARYTQMWSYGSAGPSWALVTEMRDMSNLADPPGPRVSQEADVFGNGTDANLNRIGLNIVGGKGVPGGASMNAFAAMWVSPANGNTGEVHWHNGINLSGVIDNAINLANATIGGTAILLPESGAIAFDASCVESVKCAFPNSNRKLYYTVGNLLYTVLGVNKFQVTDAGALFIQDNFSLGSGKYICFTSGVACSSSNYALYNDQTNTIINFGTSGVFNIANNNVTISQFDGVNSVFKVVWNTTSSNSTTGAFVVTGGVGIGGALNVGGAANVTGNVNVSGVLKLTPATWANNQTCTAGQVSVDTGFIYVCTASNTVKRVAISTF